jgi:hypothetical protein
MALTFIVSMSLSLLTVIAISCGMTVYELHCIRRNKSVKEAALITKDKYI